MSFSLKLVPPLFLAAAISYLAQKWWDNFSRLKNVPVPGGASKIWGHEWLEFEDDRGNQWREWLAKVGPVFRLKAALGHHDILCVTDPKAIEYICSKNVYNYPRGPAFRPLIERIAGRGLAWVEGEKEHKSMRAMLAPAFTLDRIKDMAPDVWIAANGVINRLTGVIEENGGSKVINTLYWTATSTLDVIGRVAFGHDFEQGQSYEARRINDAWRKQANLVMTFQGFLSLLLLRQFPWIAHIPLPTIEAQSDVKNMVKPLARRIIDRGISAQERGRDLLSILLTANEGQVKGNHVTDDELLEHITTFVMAGHETTSSVLDFTLYALAHNPIIQRKLREELNSLTGEPSFDDLWPSEKFPYLDAVVREGLRVFPPATRTEKVAEKDDLIPLATPILGANNKPIYSIPIKSGQVIHIPSIAINRLDAIWGDGDVFRPERWIEKNGKAPSNFLTGAWNGTMSFLVGPRSCVAYRLAVFELKVLVMSFVRAFEIEEVCEIETRMTVTMHPRVVGKEHEGVLLPLRFKLVT